jgi:hypothetical protein
MSKFDICLLLFAIGSSLLLSFALGYVRGVYTQATKKPMTYGPRSECSTKPDGQ